TVTRTVQLATATAHLYRERVATTKTNTGHLWGEPPPRAPRAILGEPHQNAAQPNGTLRTTGATQRNEHGAVLRENLTRTTTN
ncbi:hypothetical protein Taro_019618, partial [Colocasia esculenta]|nr:hypothetical protein [Colocasia esculenta]